LPDGTRLDFTTDVVATADALRKLSVRDAERWPRFCERMRALTGVLEDLYAAPPPDPLTHETGGLIELGRIALRLRKLGRLDMTELLRLVPMSVADMLDSWFESDTLKGVLGVQGVRHLAQGPRSGGTAFNFLHHHVGCAPGVFRQRHSKIDATPAGWQRVDADAVRIEISESRATGVVLDNGDTIAGDIVVSALDPNRTLLGLIDTGSLDPELVRAVRNIRSRGVAAYVTFTVGAAADFSTLVIAPSLDHLERAYDDSKYGRVSRNPLIEASYAGHATHGAHRVEALVQYVPYALREGPWDDARGKALADAVEAQIDRAAPGFASRVIDASVLTPADLEAQYGHREGQTHHAEIALDQVLWMRPVPELARYRTPLRGLYLCGPAMHPGIAGRAGANAATVILQDVKN
jgi:phytoene dehydrogenase-like protein